MLALLVLELLGGWALPPPTANSTLHFKENDVRLRETVRYENYKQFKAQSTITFAPEDDKNQPKESTPPKKP